MPPIENLEKKKNSLQDAASDLVLIHPSCMGLMFTDLAIVTLCISLVLVENPIQLSAPLYKYHLCLL